MADIEKSNKKAKKVLDRGAESIKFIIPSREVSIQKLLAGIDLDSTPIHFELQFLDSEFIKQISVIPAEADKPLGSAKLIHVNTDIIGRLARTGNWYKNLNDDLV